MLVQRTVDVKMGHLTRIIQRLGNLTITRGLWLTHVHDRSCQMKSVLNFDTFLGTTIFRKLVTNLCFQTSSKGLSNSHATIMSQCCFQQVLFTYPSHRHQKQSRTNWSRIFSISLQNV
ncbi:hypothetical protein NPIL_231041 [Nephila pilipes]|uniref:Uncharacterized protein n=1 Tax=Nephila pilipes TaxID=299642 RepID=A0A8X6URX2_NEPPI|nr:hypothetical protein NPIL_231041 [Nephila pilipes]